MTSMTSSLVYINVSQSDNLDSTVEFNQEKIGKDLSEPKFLITSTGDTVTVDDIFASFARAIPAT